MTSTRFRSRLPVAFLLSGLLAATFTLLEPAKSAVSNWSEITIGFEDLATRLAVPFAAAYLAIATLAVLLIALAPRRGLPVLVALYVSLWAQGSLFLWEYGSFDGSPIDWSEHSGKGFLELGFWMAVLVLALTKHAWIQRRALPITAIVFALQMTALAGQVLNHAPFPRSTGPETQVVHSEGTTDLSLIQSVSRFSSDLNVIIVVLDTVQSDIFSEAMRDPELSASMPPGFTYYRNAVSMYHRTEFSIQSILSSRAVPDNVNFRQWTKAHVEKTLPAVLTERGFDAVLMTVIRGQYEKFASWRWRRVLGESVVQTGPESNLWRDDVSNLFAIGLFRLSPHFLKSRIYDEGDWQARRLYPPHEFGERDPKMHWGTRTDLGVFDELMTSASADDTAPRFRLLHFWSTHRPYVVDEKCRYAGSSSFDRKGGIAVTRCILSRLFAFFHKLDEIDVYDKSVIFVVGDHGSKLELDLSAASPALPDSKTPRGPSQNQPVVGIEDSWWRGVPLFLAKPLGDRKPFRISDQPVSLCDVPNSVLDALSMDGDFECESIFLARNSRQTPRIHYRYPDLADRGDLKPGGGYPFEKYSVLGHSWLRDSWIPLQVDEE